MKDFEEMLDGIEHSTEDTELAFRVVCFCIVLAFGLVLGLYLEV